MDYILITMPLFNNSVTTLTSVINWGVLDSEGFLIYDTRFGQQRKKPNQLGDNLKAVTFEGINIEKSLNYWRKANPNAYGKPFVIDYSITQGEIYRQFDLPLMIQETDKQILIKPIFD